MNQPNMDTFDEKNQSCKISRYCTFNAHGPFALLFAFLKIDRFLTFVNKFSFIFNLLFLFSSIFVLLSYLFPEIMLAGTPCFQGGAYFSGCSVAQFGVQRSSVPGCSVAQFGVQCSSVRGAA